MHNTENIETGECQVAVFSCDTNQRRKISRKKETAAVVGICELERVSRAKDPFPAFPDWEGAT